MRAAYQQLVVGLLFSEYHQPSAQRKCMAVAALQVYWLQCSSYWPPFPLYACTPVRVASVFAATFAIPILLMQYPAAWRTVSTTATRSVFGRELVGAFEALARIIVGANATDVSASTRTKYVIHKSERRAASDWLTLCTLNMHVLT